MDDHIYNSDNIYLNDLNNDDITISTDIDNEQCDLIVNKDCDQLLIDLIRSYPHLWDKQKKDYKDIVKKETSWNEISTILHQSVSTCQSRWQRLRQYYAKERQKQDMESKSGSKAVSRTPWYLFSSMNFLDKYMYRRKTFTNLKKCTTVSKSHDLYINDDDSMNEGQSASYNIIDTLDNGDSSRESFLDLTNTNSLSPMNSSGTAQFSKRATSSIQFQRPSPSVSPQMNISAKSTPSPSSTSFPSTCKSSTKSKRKMDSDVFEDSFRAVSTSVLQISNRIAEKENETRDHALANLLLKELLDAQEPKKSMLRKKIMQVLTDHMSNLTETN